MWPFKSSCQLLEEANPIRIIGDIFLQLKPKAFAEKSNPSVQTIVNIEVLRREVDNGTVDQYLTNSSGNNFNALRENVQKVGALATLSILDEIAGWFPDSQVPTDRTLRTDQLVAFSDAMGEEAYERLVRLVNTRLTETFEELFWRTIVYLRRHMADFEGR